MRVEGRGRRKVGRHKLSRLDMEAGWCHRQKLCSFMQLLERSGGSVTYLCYRTVSNLLTESLPKGLKAQRSYIGQKAYQMNQRNGASKQRTSVSVTEVELKYRSLNAFRELIREPDAVGHSIWTTILSKAKKRYLISLHC